MSLLIETPCRRRRRSGCWSSRSVSGDCWVSRYRLLLGWHWVWCHPVRDGCGQARLLVFTVCLTALYSADTDPGWPEPLTPPKPACCSTRHLPPAALAPSPPLHTTDGFGAEGRAPDVPPNSTLEIELTLLSWKKVEKVSHTTQFVYPILLSLQPGKDGNRPAELEEGGKGEGCDARCLFVVARAYSVAPKAALGIMPHVISCA